MNVDDSPRLAARYGVQSLPSLMVFKDGRITAKQTGLANKTRLKAMLDLSAPTPFGYTIDMTCEELLVA